MKSIFDKINIESIQFEAGINEVHVTCKISQGIQTFQSELVINFTDLNLLIGRIQQLNSDMDLMGEFEKIDMGEGPDYYYLKGESAGIADLWIDGLEFSTELRQIRA